MSKKIGSSVSVLLFCLCLVLAAVIRDRNTEQTESEQIEMAVIAAEPELIVTKMVRTSEALIKEMSQEEIAATNRWGISLTEDEIDLLAGILWLEANGEPTEGQEAIVEVVFNRMVSDSFPDNLYDILSQTSPVQFCSWSSRSVARPTQKEYESIYNVLLGRSAILREDTCYFATSMLTSQLDVQIAHHYFCY